MGRNKFSGVWFGLGVLFFLGGLADYGNSMVVGALFLITAYLHEGLLALHQIEANPRSADVGRGATFSKNTWDG